MISATLAHFYSQEDEGEPKQCVKLTHRGNLFIINQLLCGCLELEEVGKVHHIRLQKLNALKFATTGQ